MRADKLIDLAKVAARYGGLYTTHIRGEGANSPQSLSEAIARSRQSRSC